jgi:hypothetical protein
MNILAPKIGTLQILSKEKNSDFLGKGYNEFYYISIFYEDNLPKYNWVPDIFWKITVRALGVQMGDVDFVETSFTGRTDSTVVRYSSTNNGLASNNRFRFQGNVVEINSIWKSMCIAFTHIFLMYQ